MTARQNNPFMELCSPGRFFVFIPLLRRGGRMPGSGGCSHRRETGSRTMKKPPFMRPWLSPFRSLPGGEHPFKRLQRESVYRGAACAGCSVL